MCGHILISSAWCMVLGFARNVIGTQPILSLDAGWLKLSNFLFIPAPLLLSIYTSPLSFPAFIPPLPSPLHHSCLFGLCLPFAQSHPSWLIDMCWAVTSALQEEIIDINSN